MEGSRGRPSPQREWAGAGVSVQGSRTARDTQCQGRARLHSPLCARAGFGQENPCAKPPLHISVSW